MPRFTFPLSARLENSPTIALLLLLAVAAPVRAQHRAEPAVRASSSSRFTNSSARDEATGIRLRQLDCDLDRTRGRQAANTLHSGSGWMIGGVASGVLLGLIGTGVITAIAASSSASTNHVPDGAEPACYREGYAGRARSMNTTSALTGGLIGTLALVIIVVSASGS